MKEPKGEMSEKNLLRVAEIFWEGGGWISQKKFYYDPNNRRKYYKVDCYSEVRNIVWEYEGPDHYENVWKLRRDEQRQDYFVNMGIKFLRWPYYCQLTKDVAQYFLGENYTEKKYATAISEVYGADEESEILAPGFHTTKNTPANFVARGERRFLAELDEFPISLKHQVIHCLKIYIQAVDDPYLVITESKAMRKLVALEPERQYLQYYYTREDVVDAVDKQ